jgi:hypothetical protein
MKLEKIAAEHYRPFIQAEAKKKWKQKLEDAALEEILNVTICHTYYVNALCRQLWMLEKCPATKQITQAWQMLVDDQYSWIGDELNRLTPNQRLILAAFAHQPMPNPQSQIFSKMTGLSPSSVKSAIMPLLDRDLIFQDQQGVYSVLDPIFQTYLKNISAFQFEV